MTRAKYLTIPAVVAGAMGISAGTAWAAEPTTEELTKQIQQLTEKVQQLEQRQTSMNAKDVDATVEAVLRDADKVGILPEGVLALLMETSSSPLAHKTTHRIVCRDGAPSPGLY